MVASPSAPTLMPASLNTSEPLTSAPVLPPTVLVADVAAMPALIRMDDLGMPDWQDLPRVVTWFDNIRAHPAFKPTYYPGSLLSERFPHLKEKASA